MQMCGDLYIAQKGYNEGSLQFIVTKDQLGLSYQRSGFVYPKGSAEKVTLSKTLHVSHAVLFRHVIPNFFGKSLLRFRNIAQFYAKKHSVFPRGVPFFISQK